MPDLIKEGYVYLAQPPLYKLEKNKKVWYAYSDEELNDIFGQGFYDGSYSSQKKANNLKYELNRLLERMPFVVCPTTPNEIKLLGKAVR